MIDGISMRFYLRRFCGIFLFIIIGVVFFISCSQLLITCDRSDMSNIRGFYYEEDNSIDVVTLGPSEMYTAYLPTKAWHDYGYTSYNFGAGAIPCNLYTSMLKEVLEHQKPNAVVVNISDYYDGEWNYRDEVSMRKWLDNIPWSQNKMDTIDDVISPENHMSYYYSLWKYHSNWKHPRGVLESANIKYFLVKDQGTYNKGFLTNTTITGGYDNLVNLGDRDSLTMSFSAETEGYLRDFLGFCKESNIENVLMIAMPHQMKSINAEVINQIGEIVKEYDYDFINLDKNYEQIGINDATDFSDGEHMNIYGAEKFTDYIAKYMVEKYDLKCYDKYSKDIKDRWDNCYRLTEQFINMCKSDMQNGVRKEHWEGEMH